MRYLTRPMSAVLLATYVNACSSWKVQNVSPEQTFSDSAYVRKGVRIVTLDSQRVEIRHPQLTAGTITGWSRKGAAVTVPLQTIGELAVKRPDEGKTVMLIVGIAAGAGAVTLAALCIAFCGLDD